MEAEWAMTIEKILSMSQVGDRGDGGRGSIEQNHLNLPLFSATHRPCNLCED